MSNDTLDLRADSKPMLKINVEISVPVGVDWSDVVGRWL